MVTQTVTYLSGTASQTHTYTGASLWGILDSAGIVTTPGVKNDIANRYLLATGSDGYQTLFSLGELNPGFGNQPNMIAYQMDGASLGANGFARLVVPNDGLKGRWVSNLVNLEVFSAAPVPEPQTYALMLAGLLIVGCGAARRGTGEQHGRATTGGMHQARPRSRGSPGRVAQPRPPGGRTSRGRFVSAAAKLATLALRNGT